MSSRAHRSADDGLADFGAPELVGAEISGELDPHPVAAREVDGDVISSERDTDEVEGAVPTPRVMSRSEPPVPADNPELMAMAAPSATPGPSDETARGGPQEESEADSSQRGQEPARANEAELGNDQPDTSEPEEPGEAPPAAAGAVPAPSSTVPAPSSTEAERALGDVDETSGIESDSAEVQDGDIEPAEAERAPQLDVTTEAMLAAGPVETAEPPVPAEPDVTEMTAAELAFATQPESATAASWDGDLGSPDAARDYPEESADLAAERPAEADRPPSFDPPWVDEVPDPITPYEQRVSETVRVADLPSAEQLRGRVLANRYIAEEIAEQTPSSISYRAYHLALDRSVTVRVLPRGLACPDDTCQEVRRLAAIATALAHPHVAATLDFGVLPDGWPFLVTEQLSGNTLGLLLRQEGKFLLRRVLHIGKQLAQGLAAAHDAGLVHGLLNPDNIVIVEPGTSAEVATILGFGVSSARGSVPGTPRSGVFGVPFYVSPEQAGCRPLDARSDIYSLGVVLYEMMTGRPPFTDGDFAGVLCQHLDDEAPPPSSRLRAPGALAKAIDAIIQRCLRKEPARRYQTADELEEDLVRLEAAAARTKRRPMPEVKRPTTTIHSPAPKAEGTAGPEAKVIVHGEDSDSDAVEDASVTAEPASGRAVSPASSRSRGAPPVSGTEVLPRDSSVPVAVRPPVSRAPRISVDQATIKISAVDRALLVGARPGAQIQLAAPKVQAAKGGLGAWLLGAWKRLFGGGPGDAGSS